MRCAKSSMLEREVCDPRAAGRSEQEKLRKMDKRKDQLSQDIMVMCCPGRECASTLHLCRKCGREAGSDFHENKTGGRADQRGCLILSRSEAGRRFSCNNEVKRTIALCDDLRGGASLLPAPSPDPLDLQARGDNTRRRDG